MYKTYKTNLWLTFETQHFSSFYILGSKTSTKAPLMIENIILLVLASLNLVLIALIGLVFVRRKDNKVYSTTLPILIIYAFSVKVPMLIILSVS